MDRVRITGRTPPRPCSLLGLTGETKERKKKKRAKKERRRGKKREKRRLDAGLPRCMHLSKAARNEEREEGREVGGGGGGGVHYIVRRTLVPVLARRWTGIPDSVNRLNCALLISPEGENRNAFRFTLSSLLRVPSLRSSNSRSARGAKDRQSRLEILSAFTEHASSFLSLLFATNKSGRYILQRFSLRVSSIFDDRESMTKKEESTTTTTTTTTTSHCLEVLHYEMVFF